MDSLWIWGLALLLVGTYFGIKRKRFQAGRGEMRRYEEMLGTPLILIGLLGLVAGITVHIF